MNRRGPSRRSRRLSLGLVALALGAVLALVWPVTPLTPSGRAVGAAGAAGPLAVYVSTSGITHGDVADVATLRAGQGWVPGDPNSIDSEWVTAENMVWHQLASVHPDALFATGDMIQGYWGVDDDHTGIFGPVDTYQHRVQAVENAAQAYEGAVRHRYKSSGLAVYPGMGDHEIGDFGHSGVIGPSAFKARAHWAWVKSWKQIFGHQPHYHVSLPGGVGLWTLQPFQRGADGGLSARIGRTQRAWLARSLDASTDRWKLVQTEIPPYASKGFTGQGTSGTLLHDADRLYRLMARHGVDLVLGAEFHDVDALQRRGLPEIIHGGAMAAGTVNYLTIKVYAHVLRVTVSRMAPAVLDNSETLWCPSSRLRVAAHITMTPGAEVTGHMEITHDGATYADGDLSLH